MKKILCALALMSAAVMSACVVETGPGVVGGDYYGSAFYDVAGTETIVDKYGYKEEAYCTGTVEFFGWFDATCDALIQSESRYATLFCDYYDFYGDYHTFYDDSFYFPTGYISEYCSYGKPAHKPGTPVTSDEMAVDSTTQAIINNGQMQAVVTGHTGARIIDAKLGKGLSIDEMLKTKNFTPVRTPGKQIEKITTKEEAAAK